MVKVIGTMRPISEWHLTAQTSTTSLRANSPKASSRLSGGSDDLPRRDNLGLQDLPPVLPVERG